MHFMRDYGVCKEALLLGKRVGTGSDDVGEQLLEEGSNLMSRIWAIQSASKQYWTWQLKSLLTVYQLLQPRRLPSLHLAFLFRSASSPIQF